MIDVDPALRIQTVPVPNRLVLLVSTDQVVRQTVGNHIAEQGFKLDVSGDLGEATVLARSLTPAIVLLDVDNFESHEARFLRTPYISLSRQNHPALRANEINRGAEGFMAKPINMDFAGATIRSVLRRYETAANPMKAQPVKVDDVEIDLDKRMVKKSGAGLILSTNEWHLIQYMAQNVHRIIPVREILTEVWGKRSANDVRLLTVQLSRFRQKIETDPLHPKVIITYPDIGYGLGTNNTALRPYRGLAPQPAQLP